MEACKVDVHTFRKDKRDISKKKTVPCLDPTNETDLLRASERKEIFDFYLNAPERFITINDQAIVTIIKGSNDHRFKIITEPKDPKKEYQVVEYSSHRLGIPREMSRIWFDKDGRPKRGMRWDKEMDCSSCSNGEELVGRTFFTGLSKELLEPLVAIDKALKERADAVRIGQ